MYDTHAQITNKYKTFKNACPFCFIFTVMPHNNNVTNWKQLFCSSMAPHRKPGPVFPENILWTNFSCSPHSELPCTFLPQMDLGYSLTLITSIICIKRMDSLVCCSERSLSWCMYSLHHKLYFSANLALTFICRVYCVLCLSSYFLFLPVFPLYLAPLTFFLYAVSCCLWLALQCSLLTVWIMTSSLPTSL